MNEYDARTLYDEKAFINDCLFICRELQLVFGKTDKEPTWLEIDNAKFHVLQKLEFIIEAKNMYYSDEKMNDFFFEMINCGKDLVELSNTQSKVSGKIQCCRGFEDMAECAKVYVYNYNALCNKYFEIYNLAGTITDYARSGGPNGRT